VFDPIRSYDKPEVILTQLANGIATTDSVRRVLFDPGALSPRERQTFADSLKRQYGGNAVSDLAVDVLTNPLVWLGMMTAGTGGVAARNIAQGRRFFAGGGRGHWASNAAKGNWPALRMFGLLSGVQESVGRSVAPLLQWGITKMDRSSRRLVGVVEGEVGRVMDAVGRKHGVKLRSMDPDEAPNEAVGRDLRRIRSVVALRLLGHDQDRVERVVEGVKPARYHVRLPIGPGEDGRVRTRTYRVDEKAFRALAQMAKGKDHYVGDMNAVPGERPVWADFRLRKAKSGRDTGLTIGDMVDPTSGKLRIRLGLNDVRKVGDVTDPKQGKPLTSLVAGGPAVERKRVMRKKWVSDQAAMDAVSEEFGLDSFVAANRRLYTTGKVMVAGDEAAFERTGLFVPDREKVTRMARANLRQLQEQGYIDSNGNINRALASGEEAVRALLTDEVAEAMMKARKRHRGAGATPEELEKVVVDAMIRGYEDPFYMPRNTLEARNSMGRRIAFNPYMEKDGGRGVGGTPDMGASGRSQMRVRTAELPWDPDDLEFVANEFGGTETLLSLIGHERGRVMGQVEHQGFSRMLRLAPDIAADKYITSTARDYTFFASNALLDNAVRVTRRDYMAARDRERASRLPGPTGASKRGIRVEPQEYDETTMDRDGGLGTVRRVDYDIERDIDGARPTGGYSLYDLIDAELDSVRFEPGGEDKYYVNLWRKHIIPAAVGIKPQGEGASAAAAGVIRSAAEKLANSKFMRAVEDRGGWGNRFVRDLRRWATDSTGDEFRPFQSITRGLYASHMGLNVGTVLVNLLQPIQSVHHLGFKETVKAYSQSFEQIGSYLSARTRLGPGATREQIENAMRRSFTRRFGDGAVDLVDVADLGGTWQMLDKAGYGARSNIGKPQFSLLEMVMKPFQLSETLNRTVTANAVLNQYAGARRTVGFDRVRAEMDAALAVQQFQFGTNPLTRPALFYQPILREPAFRQFAQFGLRSFANMFTVPGMVGGTRRFLGQEVSGKAGVTLVDTMRLLAASAVTYETFKSTLGLDLSRGLALGMTDLVGGQQALTKDQVPLYIPPVVDLGWDAIRMLGTGDIEILKDVVPRTIPAGIAISRLVGTMPESKALQSLGLQKTYADWSQAESGMVPVFNVDGRFMGNTPTQDVILRSFGADLGRFGNPQEVSQFLLKNRDAIRAMRRDYISSVLGNNMGRAASIKKDFERRFGLPLTVTQDQVKTAIKLRESSVVGRTLETIDRGARDIFREAVSEAAPGQLDQTVAPVERGDVYRWATGR